MWKNIIVSTIIILVFGCGDAKSPTEANELEEEWLLEQTDSLPEKLSEFGLFAELENEIPADYVIPYSVRYPLFSDYNQKSRYLYLPEGSKIDNSNSEEWLFPTGTTFFKTFYLTTLGNDSIPLKQIETRVLHKKEDGWQTATYQWNDAGDEAIITNHQRIQLNFELPGGTYTYTLPSRSDCAACHEPETDFVIGFEAIRLNLLINDLNQLHDLSGRAIFLADPEADPQIDGDELTMAAIGYLHGNCANCHNPNSTAFHTTELDLRYWNVQEETIDVFPMKFASADSALRLISPGRPEKSLIYLLMNQTFENGTFLMPPIGTSQADTVGLNLLKSWIQSLADKERTH